MPIIERECPRCKKVKDLKEFQPRKGYGGENYSVCDSCRIECGLLIVLDPLTLSIRDKKSSNSRVGKPPRKQ